ncbi:MAG: hypothetical protein JKY51_06455 [Opitutaceae bacterium]|nr:hypothetical protein [Opitutaceae bacterium]
MNRSKKVLNLSDKKQVFIDGLFLEQSFGVKLEVHQPVKTGEVAIRCEKPWEMCTGDSPWEARIAGYNSVLFDEKDELYKMWYVLLSAKPDGILGGLIAYATSRDGKTWEKPALGLDDGRFGEKTNIVIGAGATGEEYINDCHCMVFLDPKAVEAERFKMLTRPGEAYPELCIYASSDGLQWERKIDKVITYHKEFDKEGKHITADFDSNGKMINVRDSHLDSQNVIFWDDRLNKYVAYVRKNKQLATGQYRSVARAESDDLHSFPVVEEMEDVLEADVLDSPMWDETNNREIAGSDIYTNATIKSDAENAYYMFPSIYYKYGSFMKGYADEAPMNAGPVDVGFAASRDGVHWHRYDRKPFINLGFRGDDDSASIYMVHGVVPGSEGKLYLYSLDTDNLHGANRGDRYQDTENRLVEKEAFLPEKNVFLIRRHEMRKDGFISVRGDYTGGEFITSLLTFSGEQLELNVDTSATGTVAVEIQDEYGMAIEGYSLSDCHLIHTANQIKRIVQWNGSSDLSQLSGQVVKLRFAIRNADLYSFTFFKG